MTGRVSEQLEAKYGLPAEVKFCRKCVMSNQRPLPTGEFKFRPNSAKETAFFDTEGVCTACRYAELKDNVIDWDQREKELMALCDRHRSRDGSYDCIVPGSGGNRCCRSRGRRPVRRYGRPSAPGRTRSPGARRGLGTLVRPREQADNRCASAAAFAAAGGAPRGRAGSVGPSRSKRSFPPARRRPPGPPRAAAAACPAGSPACTPRRLEGPPAGKHLNPPWGNHILCRPPAASEPPGE